MVVAYVCSSEPFAGKSVACLILGRRYQQKGLKVGFFKPIGALPTREEGVTTDEDASFIVQALGIKEPMSAICPVVLTTQLLHQVLVGETQDFLEAINKAFAKISSDKDMVIVSGLGSVCCNGLMLGTSAPQIMDSLKAKAVLIGKYSDVRSADPILAAKQTLGERLAGLIINQVPRNQLEIVGKEFVPFLERLQTPVIGVLPRDQILNSISVRELAEAMHAQVMCCEEGLEELVEHFSVGAMSVDSALRYFRRTPNKAVITGGDRTDIQMAALETATRCLLLTGGLHPDSRILSRAQELGVPILSTQEDTLTTVERIEQVLGKLRVREAKKIDRAAEIAEKNLDFARLDKALGIK